MNSREYECPVCECDVLAFNEDKLVTCEECHTLLEICRDADQVDGRWCDLTTLRPISELP